MIRPDTIRCRAAPWRRAAWISCSRRKTLPRSSPASPSIPMSPGSRPNPSPRRKTTGRTRRRTRTMKRRCQRAGAAEGKRPGTQGAETGFKKVLLLLRNHSGVDFSLYKPATIQRRITRRMVLSKQDTLESYAHFLRGNAKELDALYADALISVTGFFRNPEAFDVLKRTVFPKLLQRRGDPIVPRLGARVFHRPGGVFPCHGVRGSGGERAPHAQAPGVRHRPQ